MPKRKLGRTGVEVPCLGLGALFDVTQNQEALSKAIELGITYWDTAETYFGGRSELGIGQFLSRNPRVRQDLFLVTKSGSNDPAAMQKLLEQSLERLRTDYIDLYLLHHADLARELTGEVRQWAERAKRSGKIRFFGFSTHKHPPLLAAAKLGWIDAVMTSYNFRLMQYREIQEAIEACYKAGIGLIAMKTQAITDDGAGPFESNPPYDESVIRHFEERGFTFGQAKLKAVLQDERIACACVGRGEIPEMIENAVAARDQTKLTAADMQVLAEYAHATRACYCAGCTHICESFVPGAPCIGEIMRCLVYYNGYGEPELAKELFAEIPAHVRARLIRLDYSLAEAHCPQRIPIGRKIAEALNKFS